jgi:hypothetical protein
MTHAPCNCASEAKQDLALARGMVGLTQEQELDRFLPLLLKPTLMALKQAVPGVAKTAPAVLRAAAPIVKKVIAKALPQIKAASKRPAAGGAGVVQGGFGGGVGTRDARLWGTGFQRSRPRDIQIAMSLRFVRAARMAARRAALAVMEQLRRGQPVSFSALRRLVYRALLGAVRTEAPFLLPTMGAVASSMRRTQDFTGPALPHVRPGRIQGLPPNLAGPPVPPGYTGRTLPRVRTAILGVAPQSRRPARGRPLRRPVSAGANRFW